MVKLARDAEDDRTLNQGDVTLVQAGTEVTVSADVDNLTSYALEEGGTEGKWIGIVVNTNEDDATTVKCNGTAITADQVTEADSFGLSDGQYVEWIDASSFTTDDYTYSKDGKEDRTITITLEDTGE